MEPTIGRIVHYYDDKDRGPYAAIVVGVDGRVCVLAVFTPLVNYRVYGVRQGLIDADTGEPGHGAVRAQHWFWPPRAGR